MDVDAHFLARRAAELATGHTAADLAAQLAVAQQVIEAQKALIAELQTPKAEEAAP